MTYCTFDKLVHFFSTDKNKINVFTPEHSLVIFAYPHKNIRNIFDYICKNKLKMATCDVKDYVGIFQTWAYNH